MLLYLGVDSRFRQMLLQSSMPIARKCRFAANDEEVEQPRQIWRLGKGLKGFEEKSGSVGGRLIIELMAGQRDAFLGVGTHWLARSAFSAASEKVKMSFSWPIHHSSCNYVIGTRRQRTGNLSPGDEKKRSSARTQHEHERRARNARRCSPLGIVDPSGLETEPTDWVAVDGWFAGAACPAITCASIISVPLPQHSRSHHITARGQTTPDRNAVLLDSGLLTPVYLSLP